MEAVVLLSGGVDSTVAATIVSKAKQTKAISYKYGQRHSKEVYMAAKVAERLHIDHEIIDLPELEGSPLTGDGEIPKGPYSQFEGISPAYVPFRNGVLLSVAASRAQAWGAKEVWFGAHASDWGAWAYPDCSPTFITPMNQAIRIGTDFNVELVTPLLQMTKVQVVQQGLTLQSPFELTWSCYVGKELQCGECPTCLERIEAFRQNGVIDPVPYEAEVDWGGLSY